jgi:hypothetical protein
LGGRYCPNDAATKYGTGLTFSDNLNVWDQRQPQLENGLAEQGSAAK